MLKRHTWQFKLNVSTRDDHGQRCNLHAYTLEWFQFSSVQGRDQKGAQGGRNHLGKFFAPLEKCVGHSLNNLVPSEYSSPPPWCPKLVTCLAASLVLITQLHWLNATVRVLHHWNFHLFSYWRASFLCDVGYATMNEKFSWELVHCYVTHVAEQW